MGGLLWGEGNMIKVSLDRGDTWDLREQGLTVSPAWTYAHLQELIKAKNQVQSFICSTHPTTPQTRPNFPASDSR